jgi:hypothetical protein
MGISKRAGHRTIGERDSFFFFVRAEKKTLVRIVK